jgi:SAM-dependent methyltransferase
VGNLEAHYSARDIEARILAALRAAGFNPDERITPRQLGALDHFHSGGARASLDLLELAKIRAEDRVLDIGAGLSGPARMIASMRNCRVDCIEMSADFCAGAVLLNKLTGLEDRITVRNGSALDLPFPDASFDVAWMQNVGMNIADKRALYAGIRRALKPGGRFAFQEMAAGGSALSYFPLPWASDAADSFLISIDEMRALLGECGFATEVLDDITEAQLSAPVPAAAPNPLSLEVFVDNIAQKAANSRRSLEEGQTRLVRGVFRAS